MSKISAHQLKLFNDLHNSKCEDFKTFSKKGYRGIWKSIIDKYPETAHFVYELLQNADDAKATTATIILYRDEMIFKHNGTKHFNITSEEDEKTGDINAITGIGNSTKVDNNDSVDDSNEEQSNKIGKFGVGFKAVFQYTDAPLIYDEYFKFKIENYIIPTLLTDDHPLRKKDETLFVFKFKYNEEERSYNHIVERIENLDSPILFLHNLSKIKIIIERGDNKRDEYEYSKEIVYTEEFDNKVLFSKIKLKHPKGSSSILLFTKRITLNHEGVKSTHDVNVGYFYDEKKRKLITNSVQKVFCFFPTRENFDSCFICHAPFLLTDNRQNLKPGEQTNKTLIELIGWLAAKSVLILRDYGKKEKIFLIDENIIDILPKPDWKCSPKAIHETVFSKSFEGIIRNENIFLSRNFIYLSLSESCIGAPKELIDLLSSTQLRELRRSSSHLDFLNYELIKRIKNDASLMSYRFTDYTSEKFAKDITSNFMAKQDVKWVSKFYTFLKTQATALWKQTYNKRDNKSLVFRYAPIIKTQKGDWVAPFTHNDSPNVFLPSSNQISKEYNFIHKDYLSDESSRKFFNDLDISHPDEFDYIKQVIIKRYGDENEERIDKKTIISDMCFLVKFYIENVDKRGELSSILENEEILLNEEGCCYWPCELYYPNIALKELLSEDELIHVEYYKDVIEKFGEDIFKEFLKSIGAKFKLQFGSHCYNSIPSHTQIDYTLKQELIEFGKNNDVFDWKITEWNIPYFTGCSKNRIISKELSLYIWNEVLYNCDLDDIRSPKVEYRKYRARTFYIFLCKGNSSLRNELINLKWLYNNKGELVNSKNIFFEELDYDYKRSKDIAEFLNIKTKEKSIVDLGGSEEQQECYNLGRKLKNKFPDLSEEEIVNNLRHLSEEKNRAKEELQNKDLSSDGTGNEKQDLESILKEKWDKKANSNIGKPHSGSNSSQQYTKENTYSNASQNPSSFFGDTKFSTPQYSSNEKDDAVVEKKLENRNKSAQENAQKADEQLKIYELLKATAKYTYKWYKLLIELMHADKSNVSVRHLQIDFATITFRNNDKILNLSSPNLPVPLWILDAEKVSISTISDKSCKIDGCIVKVEDNCIDISIDDTQKVKEVCKSVKKIRVVAENSSNIIDSLDTRFLQLGFEDDYDMNSNLTKDIEFIYGPPGTGKTTLLVKKVSEILMQAKDKVNILILTPTNKSADVIAEKMVGDRECFKYLTRFGATESLYLIEEAGVVGNRDNTNLDDHNKNIIVTTAARYAYDYIQPNETFLCDYNWDYIIVDEASMVDIVTCTYILYKGKSSKFIISGDPKQIQPVSQNDMHAYNIYDMIGLNDFSDAVNKYDRYKVTALKTQYRSIPDIGNLVSDYTYNGIVQPYPNRAPQKPLKIDGLNIRNINFIGFEIQDFDLIKGLSEVDGSAFHLYSAIFAYKFTEHVIKQINIHFPEKEYSIGIVSPYRAQANAIKQMLENRPIHNDLCSVTCGTVHSFQGDECDIMLLVMNPPLQCSSGSHINNQNIINVAMSRARDYIFFIMPQGQPRGMVLKEQLNYVLKDKQKGMFYSPGVESVIFGSPDYIVSNTHVTCHMPVNVYCDETSKYEVRMSSEAIDIKINE